MTVTTEQRVLACLQGVATGDAVGKQTEGLSRESVLRWYPDGVRGFEGEPGTPIPRYTGNRKREWRIGETTDDTENTLAVARAILRDGGVRHESVGRELLRGTKSVHPGVKSLWEFHQAADPARVSDRHDGCGAAVRAAPIGILYCSARLDDIVTGAREASIPTHGGPVALAAAAATAAAVSAALDGAGPGDIIALAERAAVIAERTRTGSADSVFASALRSAYNDLERWHELSPADIAGKYFPVTPLTIVPLAITLGTIVNSVEHAILLATNVGGDADSVASIAAAITASRLPATVNADWVRVVDDVNAHQLAVVAEPLSRLRS